MTRENTQNNFLLRGYQALRSNSMRGANEKRSKAYKWHGARVSQFRTKQNAKNTYKTSYSFAWRAGVVQRIAT